MTENLEVSVSVPCKAWRRAVPAAERMCRRAARAALSAAPPDAARSEASVVLADDVLVRRLNRQYGDRDKATNVLSFPVAGGGAPAPGAPTMLGDVIVAFETATAEAKAENKPLGDHLCHLVVHGMLHLLGHDHATAAAARRMEGLEVRVLNGLGVASPYPEPANG